MSVNVFSSALLKSSVLKNTRYGKRKQRSKTIFKAKEDVVVSPVNSCLVKARAVLNFGTSGSQVTTERRGSDSVPF